MRRFPSRPASLRSRRHGLRICVLIATAVATAAGGFACTSGEEAPLAGDTAADEHGHSAPTRFTIEANRRVADALALDDPTDFEDAMRGHIASEDDVVVEAKNGSVAWDTRNASFLGERGSAAPPSVNPSLWRQAHLNSIHGLFEVTDGVHQVRGYDLANLTLIDGQTGWIVVDPLTNEGSARAAMALARKHLGDRRVSAIILTHSHIDHFGGVLGVVDPAEVASGRVRVIAPEGFVHEATSENIIAGPVMIRRAGFMYGFALADSVRGHVDTGLGREPGTGDSGFIEPTDLVVRTPQPMTIDGVRFVFQNAPQSEAPAELSFYLPDHRAYCGAELVSHTMHNLYTLRGAKVRDALRWAGYIDEAIELFSEAEVVFASHHWPVWGRERGRQYLEGQRDLYKFLHDQTLRMASLGHTPGEIAEEIALPDSIASSFANRGYYGTAKHNSRAVYQGYFGWFDGNPAHLDPLPPVESARRTVEWMGGSTAILERAQAAYERGEYRWVAEVLDRLVFAEPENREARELLARCYDQLGYQAESGPWRDVYLSGAFELRHGAQRGDLEAALGILPSVPIPRFFDALATRIDPERAADAEGLSVLFDFTDRGEALRVDIQNAVLHHRPSSSDAEADATIRLTHRFFLRMASGQLGIRDAFGSDELSLEGSRLSAIQFFRLLGAPDDAFEIVAP